MSLMRGEKLTHVNAGLVLPTLAIRAETARWRSWAIAYRLNPTAQNCIQRDLARERVIAAL